MHANESINFNSIVSFFNKYYIYEPAKKLYTNDCFLCKTKINKPILIEFLTINYIFSF